MTFRINRARCTKLRALSRRAARKVKFVLVIKATDAAGNVSEARKTLRRKADATASSITR